MKIEMKIDAGAYLPVRAHDTDAGYDLCAIWPDVVPALGSQVFDTGVHLAIPKGYCGLLVSKSGLNVKHGITSTGLIDSGYTGSIKVKLYNHTVKDYQVEPGEKISQIVFLPCQDFDTELVMALANTDRGEGGFGSTGKKFVSGKITGEKPEVIKYEYEKEFDVKDYAAKILRELEALNARLEELVRIEQEPWGLFR